MPRGPAPSWTAAAPHTVEARPRIEAACKIGYDIELTWANIPTRERAADLKRGLHNAGRLHKPQVSVSGDIEPDGNGQWRIRFKVHDKRKARAYVVAKYGPDRNQWAYNARAKG